MSNPQSSGSASPSVRHQDEHKYTVIVRLPFPRNGFRDPAPVDWNSTKDRQLWRVISTSTNKNINWEEISTGFKVSLPFLLQQAAWLYERHFAGMKAQMKRIGGGSENPAPGSGSGSGSNTGGVAMARTGSGDSRMAPSSFANHGSIQVQQTGASSSPPKSIKPVISRTPSSGTITQSRVLGGGVTGSGVSSRNPPLHRVPRGSSGSNRRPTLLRPDYMREQQHDENAIEPEPVVGSDTDSEGLEQKVARSQAFRRNPLLKRSTINKGTRSSKTVASAETNEDDASGEGGEDDDEEDDESGGFLPFAASTRVSAPVSQNVPSAERATVSTPTPQGQAAFASVPQRPKITPAAVKPDSFTTATEESSQSSASSAVMQQMANLSEDPVHRRQAQAQQQQRFHAGALSPRHRAQLSNLSPRGSEGSPSMGSSFSDLDDASVTQSLLEEALMSNMRQGNFSSMASRMGSIKDALGKRTNG